MTTKRKLAMAVMMATASISAAQPQCEFRFNAPAICYGTESWKGRGKRKMPRPT